MNIAQVAAHQILDSRGNPTLDVHVSLDNGMVVNASAPAGASVGKHEAVEIRDHNYSSYLGLSVGKAIKAVNEVLGPHLKGMDPSDQQGIDQVMIKLDGTSDKSKLGGNALIATSAAVAKAGAVAVSKPLFQHLADLGGNKNTLHPPTPMFNVINGGLHGTGNLDFQEFMVVPAHRLSYDEALKIGDEIYLHLKDVLQKKSLLTSVGDEGGFTPSLFTNASALDLLVEAVGVSGYKLGENVFISIDVAANQLRHGDRYFVKDSSEPFSSDGLITFYQMIVNRYKILSLEDPIAEDDRGGWKQITAALGSSTIIVGDDLTVTNPRLVKEAISEHSITGLIVKPNQIGTVTEALEVVKLAKESQLTVIVSHRSGETEDTFIADFAVGVGADYFKGGAPARGERTAKYNRFLEIEAQLAVKAS